MSSTNQAHTIYDGISSFLKEKEKEAVSISPVVHED